MINSGSVWVRHRKQFSPDNASWVVTNCRQHHTKMESFGRLPYVGLHGYSIITQRRYCVNYFVMYEVDNIVFIIYFDVFIATPTISGYN